MTDEHRRARTPARSSRTTAGAEVVPDLLRERAEAEPGAVAVRVGESEGLTYGDWDARSNAVARGLVERGIRPGDRVALVLGNDRWVDFAVSYLAVHKAGAVAVPLGTRFTGAELEGVLAHAGATGVVASTVDAVPTDAWVAEPGSLEAGQSADPFQAPVGPDDLAEIIYTSGTTARSKGVAVTHLGLMAHDLPDDGGRATQAGADGPPADRSTSFLHASVSFLHAFPIGTQAAQEALRVPLRFAGRVAVVLPTFDPRELCALVERHRVARLQLVPAMAQMIVVSGAYRDHDVSSVRRVILSSAPAPPALFARLADAFPQASLWNAYALTEAGAARTLMPWDASRPTAVGLPVGKTEVRIVDDAGHDAAAGEVGEVWLRRRGTPTRSYYRDPEATAAVFAGGWVRTGDVGHVDADGYVHLTDRKKDLVIRGGLNVSSVEVENALYEHPAVVEAAVFGVPHPVLGEDVAAAVVVRSPTTERELQDVVRSRLPEHKVPHRVMLVEGLPRNPSGKVVKAELRRRFGAEATAASGDMADARDETEAVVASVWAAVLALPKVGIHDDFFVLGGHSLAAAQIVARLHDAFGVDLAVAAVFESPTVAELAAAVTEARGGDDGTGAGAG